MTRVLVEADGGSRGNPGPAGYGAVVRDADTGQLLREVKDAIGVATNNVAEYQGLIAGLQAAAELGADEVDVRMDSLLVVNQMSQKWKIKHEAMRPLASQAAQLVRRFRRVTFTHIPRELNKHADRLANEAMDAAAGVVRRAPRAATAAAPAAAADAGAPAASSPAIGWSAPTGPKTSLLLLRHGETPLSVEKRFSGLGDPALTERGVAQARAAAGRLSSCGVTAVVSSPLQRARQTAEEVARAAGVDVTVEPGFAETDFGLWEGLTFAEIAARWPREMTAWRADPAVAPPGGESFAATAERVAAARARLLDGHPGGNVVVVAHVTPIKTLLRQALDAPMHVLYRILLDPASLSAVDWWADGSAVVRLVNDTGHLGAGLATRSR